MKTPHKVLVTKTQMIVIKILRGELEYPDMYYRKSYKTRRTKRSQAAIDKLIELGYIEAVPNQYLRITKSSKNIHFYTK